MISEWFVEKKIGNNPFLVKFVEKNVKWPLGVWKKMISKWIVEKKIGNVPFLVKFVEKNAKWPLGGV